MRRPSLRRVIWVSGIAWIVSWFCLGLEIFYWHHVTKTLHLNPPKAPPGYPKPQPGQFLLSVLAGSALAPAVFLIAVIVARAGRQSRRHPGATAQDLKPAAPARRHRPPRTSPAREAQHV